MSELIRIPMFPLSIFPLPGELVPLHIFEPRYKELLEDAEKRDIAFGIYFNHPSNNRKLGSLVKLESVIKRYATGESDVIVRCTDLFEMNTLHRTYRDKKYPGGDVTYNNIDPFKLANPKVTTAFQEYLSLMKINQHEDFCTCWTVAVELNLTVEDRLKFVSLDDDKKQSFLFSRLTFHKHLLEQAEKAKDVFHLN